MVKSLAYAARVCFVGCFVSCAFSPSASKHTHYRQLIARAEQEVLRRRLPLPAGYTCEVNEVVAALHVGPSQYFYSVTFYQHAPKRTVRLYTVSFDRQSGRLTDLIDRRGEITPDEIAAAKRAMIHRVGGTPGEFSAGCWERGDIVEFTILDLRGPSRRSGHCLVRRKTLEVLQFKLLPPTI